MKTEAEWIQIDFDDGEREVYNRPLKIGELDVILGRTQNSSPPCDSIP